MNKRLIYGILITAALIIGAPFCFSDVQGEEEVGFTDLIATTSETHLILFGVVHNSFSEEMISGLRSGVPVDFAFSIELFRKIGEEKEQLTQMDFLHTMTYDTLKESYKVELGEMNNKILLFDDLLDAQRTMSEINGVRVVELSRLLPDSSYKLRIRANMFEKTLPLSLHKLLPFLSWWDKQTEWYTLEFNY